MFDGEALGKQLVVLVRDFVARSNAPLQERLSVLEDAIKSGRIVTKEELEALPKFDSSVITQAVSEVVAALPKPQDGKSVEVDDVRPLVSDLVAKAVSELPVPKDGRDPDPEQIRVLVKEEIDQLPPPKDGVDGKDIDHDQVRKFIDQAVQASVASIPKPADGKDADPEAIRKAVQEAVAAIPPPADGRDGQDADPAEIARLVDQAIGEKFPEWEQGTKDFVLAQIRLELEQTLENVAKAYFDSLPKPRDGKDGLDGKDADPEVIRSMVSAQVSEKWPDLEKSIHDAVVHVVTEQVKALPVPKDGRDGNDGKSVDVAEVEGMVRRVFDGLVPVFEETQKNLIIHTIGEQIAALPKPKDGVDGKDADADQIKAAVLEVLRKELPGQDELVEFINTKVNSVVDAIPEPKNGVDGKDAEVDYQVINETIRREIDGLLPEHVKKALNDLPKPKDGVDGKDAVVDYEVLELYLADRIERSVPEAVQKAVAEIPPARDGVDGKDAIAPEIDYSRVESHITEQVQRTVPDAVQKAVAEIPKPRDGVDGKDAIAPEIDYSRVESHITEQVQRTVPDAVQKAVAEIPKPRDGVDGKDAVAPEIDYARVESHIVEQVQRTVPEVVQKAVAEIPKPRDGVDGISPEVDYALVDAHISAQVERSLPGVVEKAVAEIPKPRDGKDVDPEAVRVLVTEEVTKAVSSLPVPQDGEPGKDANIDEVVERIFPEVMEHVKSIKTPTVEDFLQMFQAEQSKWALDFERRAGDLFQRVIDRIPVPKDGRDALDLDDMEVESDDNGRVTFRFVRGELTKEFQIRLPRFADRGVYKQGDEYEKGDGVTWAGSFFIAQTDQPEGKPGESADWRMAVKRGRDGKDMTPQQKGPTPPIKLR